MFVNDLWWLLLTGNTALHIAVILGHKGTMYMYKHVITKHMSFPLTDWLTSTFRPGAVRSLGSCGSTVSS